MEEENVKKHIHQIIGITDDERVLAECNLIEEILNKEDKLSQYSNLQDRIDKAIEHIKGTHFYGSRTIGKSLFNEYFNELLNILRGEDNEIN